MIAAVFAIMPRGRLYQPDFQDLTVVDFSDLAQGCKTYDEFIEKMGHVPESTLQYFGVAICGPKKKVNKLTGSTESSLTRQLRKLEADGFLTRHNFKEIPPR